MAGASCGVDGDQLCDLRLERPPAPVSVAPRGRRRWAAGGPSYALSPSASQGIFQPDPGGRLYFPIVADGGRTPRRLHAADQPVVALFCHSGYLGVLEGIREFIAMSERSRWVFLASLVSAVLLGGVFAVV